MTSTAASDPATAPLWARTRAMFARATAAVGSAAAIAALEALPPKLRLVIVRWLYPLENIVRKLLLAEAGALQRAPKPRDKGPRVVTIALGSPPQQARAATRTQAHRSCDLTAPETWRADFSFALPHNPQLVPESQAPRIRNPWAPLPPPLPPRALRIVRPEFASFRLARRFEALRRVLHNPLPYAARLARLMKEAIRRLNNAVLRYIMRPTRTNWRDPNDWHLCVDAISAAFTAETAFNSS